MPILVETTQAIVDTLNSLQAAGEFSQRFTAERFYVAQFDLAKIEGILVPVMLKGLEGTVATRAAMQDDIAIDIGVLKKVPSAHRSEIDPLIGLLEELMEKLRTRFTLIPSSWTARSAPALYDQEKLRNAGEFVSVITLTFRALHRGG